MGISDDGPYIVMAQTLARTGRIAYNGWAAPMIGWQLYLGAAFIKLFGFSFTTVRSCTLLVSMALAFVLQRTLVHADISERNATIGTLALVLSPLYLILSVTYMTDMFGLFAIVLCLYGCMRALQATTDRTAIAWLCFAVVANALCGTARQIAWLGILVMVPSTLWLLRTRRRVFLPGAAATIAGAIFIFGCMHWLKQQPYIIPEDLHLKSFSLSAALSQLTYFFLEAPLLLLALTILFFPEIRRSRPAVVIAFSVLLLGYLFLALYPSRVRGSFPLHPVGEWVNAAAIFAYPMLQGTPLMFLHPAVRACLTVATIGALSGLILSLPRTRQQPTLPDASATLSWHQLRLLLGPFTIAYLLLIARGPVVGLHDRYLLGLLLFATLCLVRFYQERIQPRLPSVTVLMVGVTAFYSIVVIHNTFAFYRTRVALAAELRAAGIPDTSVDNGWEYNFGVELQHADHINEPHIVTPLRGYVPSPPLPAGTCPMNLFDDTPHIRPVYGISFTPNACYGPAPFAPLHYSRWPYRTPGTLYVVRYVSPSNH
jgi:hypothetical protein